MYFEYAGNVECVPSGNVDFVPSGDVEYEPSEMLNQVEMLIGTYQV